MDQISIDEVYVDDNIDHEIYVNENQKNDIFGCCHRYRECSNAKRCLEPDTIDFMNCEYKKNLDNGNIFYGKNANDFNMNIYKSLLYKYHSLDDSVRYELNCIIIYYQKFHPSFLWYNSDAIQILQEQGFISAYTPKRMILAEYAKLNYIKSLLDVETKNNLNKIVKQCRGNRARINKDDIVDYYIKNGIIELDEYVNRFVSLSVPNELCQYIYELYYDFVQGHDSEYIFKAPREKDNEPTFVNAVLL